MVTEPSSSRPLCYVLPTGLVNARCSPVKTLDVPSSATRCAGVCTGVCRLAAGLIGSSVSSS